MLDITKLHDDSPLTVKEYADLFRQSAGGTRNQIAAGKGPRVVRIGRSVRILLRDAKAFFESHAESHAAP